MSTTTNRTTDAAASASGTTRKPNQGRRAAVAAYLGGMLEYYDFFIYASAAALVFGDIFFPDAGGASNLASLATFGVAYIARPFGAVILGHFGDKVGRRNVLVFSLVLMGAATFLIGCLPDYNSIGIWAPILLVFLRLLQGLSAGGETAGASTLTIEQAPANRRGFYGSWALNGIVSGLILASLVFLPIAAMPREDLLSWGWRIPFWSSILVLVVAYLVRRTLDEPAVFEETKEHNETAKLPLAVVIKDHGWDVVRVAFASLFTVVNTVVAVFALSFATNNAGVPAATMLLVTICTNVAALFTQPFGAYVSDRIGRKPVFITGCIGSAVSIFFYFQAISTGEFALILLAGFVTTSLFYSISNGLYPAFFSEMFDVKVRYTGMAIGLQLGLLIAGFTPSIGTWLMGDSETNWLPVAIFTAVVCILAAIAAATAKETFRTPLKELGQRNPARSSN
ncbi:MFS transporter [Arthrobacter crystallopoietes]|uniref:Na+/melibiose symporter n=1 Tax=Crystallibacter crystallopoietes TaxID=37928 RepID=A0A1H1CYE8_9MICC|nr:MFS transporter [Arthrobacter crystallopoietes]AUI50544.1 MFS transporter [Arthrobacter crystallopoietes]SDQ69232.1 Na+/melibiose symporter [Arthrobacter crystallopoietes]